VADLTLALELVVLASLLVLPPPPQADKTERLAQSSQSAVCFFMSSLP
jgi:hypothetical protein